ncbi:UNVERIFIED_CONTAM: hypothetical protein Sradi_4010500 [Sesamum radiatum]|uniref:Uncharacterized protein n=1 Tax=Sesamum radiatum TaxID=300843 RepID=A0AAW2PJA4_SESRA
MMLWKAAKATRIVDFEKIMNELRGKDLEAFKWLAKRPAAHWSRSYFRCNAKCDILLNNMCETFNATIVEARSRPIVDMLETIRMMLMKRVYVKRDQMKKHKGKLTPNIQKLIEELKKKSMEYIAHWNGKDQFEVAGCYGDKHNLHLGEKTCSCSERMPRRPKKQDRRKTPDEMKNKKAEVTNCGEKRGKLGKQGLVMTCKICHVSGHNKRSCLQSTKNKQPEEHVEVPPGFKQKKEKRKADVMSQESNLTTSRRPLTRSIAALQGKQVEVLPLSQRSVTGPGTPSKTRKKMKVISKAKQGPHNVAATSPSKIATSADPSKTAASAGPLPNAASAGPSKTVTSARPSIVVDQDRHFELPPGCSQQ